MTKYWFHPESDSLFTTSDKDAEFINDDGLIIELTKEEYEKKKREGYGDE